MTNFIQLAVFQVSMRLAGSILPITLILLLFAANSRVDWYTHTRVDAMIGG